MQKFGEVKFSTDRVKIQIWGIPVIFSHELCLYITRFRRASRAWHGARDHKYAQIPGTCKCFVTLCMQPFMLT